MEQEPEQSRELREAGPAPGSGPTRGSAPGADSRPSEPAPDAERARESEQARGAPWFPGLGWSIANRIALHIGLLGAGALLLLGAVAQAVRAGDRREQVERELRDLALALDMEAREVLVGTRVPDRARTIVALGGALYDADALPVLPADPEPEAAANPRVRRVLETRAPAFELAQGVMLHRVPVLGERARLLGALEVRRAVVVGQPGPLWIGGGFILLAGGALLALYTRWQVRGPLRALLDAVDRVARGDLGAALPIGRPDEIGQLAFRFNEMTARLRQAEAELRRGMEAKLELEGQLRRTEKLATVGQIAAGIAHEVGTPLGVIAGRARHLARKSADPAEVAKNAEIIAEQASRITGIIRQLLDHSRRQTAREPIDLNATVRSTLAFLEHQVARASVAVTVESGDPLPRVIGRRDEIQQVCLNLTLNALQAMPGGGKLFLGTRRTQARKPRLAVAPPQDCAVLEVSDTGVGIAPDDLPRIFEPFFTSRPGGGGHGLGLAVSQGIVHDHDGWIEVAPRAGGGTTFRVFLPAEAPAPAPLEVTREPHG